MLAFRQRLLLSVPRTAPRPVGLRTLSTKPAPNVLDELNERGFVADTTSLELRSHLDSKTTVYAGVDPSASSLHVGNLLPLLGLLHFRARGHHALALIGGATGAIGDPSGRSTERNALDKETLATNVAGITNQVNRFFERGIEYAKKRGYDPEATEKGYRVLNNHDWFKDMSFLDFLRDVGKYARVNTMLARESVKTRLDSDAGISFTEFSYQLLQAHDFNVLYRSEGCRVQLGGSDQWGNIVAGIDMIKRTRAADAAQAEAAARAAAEAEAAKAQEDGKKKTGKQAATKEEGEKEVKKEEEPAFGITIPLLTTASGEKFGKSAGNAVWLDESRTSVSDFYQFFFRATDADVEKYLNVLTLLPPAEIKSVMAEHRSNPRGRHAQRTLAREVTELVHGPGGVTQAELLAKILFAPSLKDLKSSQVLEIIESGASDPRFQRVHRNELKGKPVTKLAVEYGLTKGRSEATRIVSSKGMTLNGDVVNDPRREIRVQELIDKHIAVLRKGNKDAIVFYVDRDDL